jgi:hypothetical protein
VLQAQPERLLAYAHRFLHHTKRAFSTASAW